MEAHSDIARSLDEVEREYSAIIEHLGLDTRQHRVREFIRRTFSCRQMHPNRKEKPRNNAAQE